MHRALLLILFFQPALSASTAAQVPFFGARGAALAGAATGLPSDRRGNANPAAWGHLRRWSVMAHGTQLYGLPELRYADLLLIAPFSPVRLAIAASGFGFELYRRHTLEIGVGGAARVGSYRRIYYGVRSRWHIVTIRDYGRATAAGLTAGLHLPVTPFITLGVAAHNLAVRGALRSELPRRLALGAAFSPSERFTVTTDLSKEVRAPASVSAGVEMCPVPEVIVRGGVASAPPLLALGLGMRLTRLDVDLAGVRHDVLGWTPALSVALTW